MSRAAYQLACVFVATLLLLGGLGEAQAQAQEVVVLPMTSTAKKLRLYERAISAALAQELSAATKSKVLSIASASEVPKSALLIIEGRLVAKGRSKVLMEARVRSAKTGRAIATLATAPTSTINLDALVSKLAVRLVPAIRKGLRPPPPIVLPTVIVRPTAESPGETPSLPRPARIPDMLLIPAAGSAANGVVSVRDPATASAQAMLGRLGFHSTTSRSFEGLQDVPGALAEMRRAGARFLLMINVREVQFSYRAVLSARGTVQVAVIGADGVPVFAKTVSTDTVVGSRGDRHQALVYQVASQALDMLLPEFRKLTEASGATGG